MLIVYFIGDILYMEYEFAKIPPSRRVLLNFGPWELVLVVPPIVHFISSGLLDPLLLFLERDFCPWCSAEWARMRHHCITGGGEALNR